MYTYGPTYLRLSQILIFGTNVRLTITFKSCSHECVPLAHTYITYINKYMHTHKHSAYIIHTYIHTYTRTYIHIYVCTYVSITKCTHFISN
jgi:hypothetical protein